MILVLSVNPGTFSSCSANEEVEGGIGGGDGWSAILIWGEQKKISRVNIIKKTLS
jgi:hypothetical protein